jgi:hypothetical protein
MGFLFGLDVQIILSGRIRRAIYALELLISHKLIELWGKCHGPFPAGMIRSYP